jgi:hypothetical protein
MSKMTLRLLAGWKDDNIDQLRKAFKRALGRAETATQCTATPFVPVAGSGL